MDRSRRQFMAGAAGAAGAAALASVGLSGCGTDAGPGEQADAGVVPETAVPDSMPLPAPDDAPFDTVVVLMMENRSFDHLLGWLPGADGRQADLSYAEKSGAVVPTWSMAPDWQGCDYQDPYHDWKAMAAHYNGGACNGFLATQPNGDHFPIGYYGATDLPVMAALARGYTTYDNYFSSMMGPTWPNRLYQLCATTDLDSTGRYPTGDDPRPVKLDTAIFDRVLAAGKTTAHYSTGEPITGLFASRRYDSLAHHIDQFWDDAKDGTLANVVFVDPDYSSAAVFQGTSNDFHPYGSVQLAESFVARVHDALASSPQWERMVFVLNFDESGGFFDHVAPPAAQDDTVLTGDGPFPDLKRLGFRVPAIAMGPFARQTVEQGGPYEHCSILKMIEWRWGLEPMTIRDRTANNLAETLDFSLRRDPITLPSTSPEPGKVCINSIHSG